MQINSFSFRNLYIVGVRRCPNEDGAKNGKKKRFVFERGGFFKGPNDRVKRTIGSSGIDTANGLLEAFHSCLLKSGDNVDNWTIRETSFETGGNRVFPFRFLPVYANNVETSRCTYAWNMKISRRDEFISSIDIENFKLNFATIFKYLRFDIASFIH